MLQAGPRVAASAKVQNILICRYDTSARNARSSLRFQWRINQNEAGGSGEIPEPPVSLNPGGKTAFSVESTHRF
jgi:hypothetical protein